MLAPRFNSNQVNRFRSKCDEVVIVIEVSNCIKNEKRTILLRDLKFYWI